jgi:hypothetical protein
LTHAYSHAYKPSMTIQGMRPEVEQRLRELADAGEPPDARSIDQIIAATMAGARDNETRELARQIFAEHKEFFDLIGDR